MTRTLAAFFTLALALTVPAADWPQFLGPTRDGQSPETKLNWEWPKDGPPVAWKLDVGSGWASPVVAGGKVLLFHRVQDDEVLVALDPATGKEKWIAKYATKYRDDFGFDNGPRSTPCVHDGKVFTLGANGNLHAFDLATGKVLWARDVREEYKAVKGFFGIACSPLVVGGNLVLNVGGKGAGVVALDPATGKEKWKATDDAASYSSPTAAEIDGTAAAVFVTRFGLRVFDAATGKVMYEFAFRPRVNESVQAATPLVWKDEIFLTASYATGAALVRVKGGELAEVWANDKSLSSQYNTPVRAGDYLYGVHGRADIGTAALRCVEWKTGAEKWSAANFGVASLVAADGGIVALTEAGDLVRFDATPDGYKERGRARLLDKPTRAAAALADGRLFARDGGKLVCVKLSR
ncbi:PQQ-binding-like beta-propeller repeat protein [Gemmata sp.]|uniref:PQQ-binding-like beta-propeller repeat protein n=1 Tax=Gemmata sp. TaxID=1914242 RepID=UPI003F7012C1